MYKVRCKFLSFAGDEDTFPCHFNYKQGDEFYYDGVYFTGRICPGLLPSMLTAVQGVYLLGKKYYENVMYRYRGVETRDPDMAKYDGLGFRPLKELPENASEKLVNSFLSTPKTEKAKGTGRFVCGDTRILAEFSCEAYDLSDSDYAQPFYRRAISILEKIEAEPGIKPCDILAKFSDFDRDDISPPITSILVEILLEALSDMNYIEIRDNRAFSTGREPPSRPVIG
jgi:uncharacterized repeat protein (TIGR04076 family)